MRTRLIFLALGLALPAPGLADSPLPDGFTWDSGPGRHNPASPSAVANLELRRSVLDAQAALRGRQELQRIETGPDPRPARVEAWQREQLRRLDTSDLQLELDAALLRLSQRERATLRLERDVERARQRLEIRRDAARAEQRLGRPRF